MKEDELREKLIKLALMQLNKLYIHGNHGPDTFDCAGLVWYLYNQLLEINIYENGYGISTTTKIMTSNYGILSRFKENDLNKNLKTIKKGDILLFHRQSKKESEPTPTNKYPGHCGIYLENNKFIHCPRKEGKVIIDKLEENYKNTLIGNKNIIDDNKILTKLR